MQHLFGNKGPISIALFLAFSHEWMPWISLPTPTFTHKLKLSCSWALSKARLAWREANMSRWICLRWLEIVQKHSSKWWWKMVINPMVQSLNITLNKSRVGTQQSKWNKHLDEMFTVRGSENFETWPSNKNRCSCWWCFVVQKPQYTGFFG